MKFYFLSETGDSLGIVIKLQAEGHEVCMDITDSVAENRGKGLITKSHDWKFEPDNETVIVFDCTGDGLTADMFRSAGYFVFGASALADRLEMDRRFATEMFVDCGIPVPKSKSFTSWDDAKEFANENEDFLVLKPGASGSGVIPSFVAGNRKQLIKMLDKYAQKLKDADFELQEFIKGVDISTECWFNGREFLTPSNHTLEQKKTWTGNLGPSGGCAGNVIWSCADSECPLCNQLFNKKLEAKLRELNYGPGLIDINAIVDTSGNAYALEFTPRFGYDATPTLIYELIYGGIGKLFFDMATGRAIELPLRSGFAAGVRVTIAPWPSEQYHADSGIPIEGLSNFEHFYPMDIMLEEDSNELVSCGSYGIIGVATGFGDSIASAFEEAYKVADKLAIPDKQYRIDLAEEFQSDMRKLTRAFGEKMAA